jgi:hypothetical protein
MSTDTGEGSVSVEVTATRARPVPASAVPFEATARFTFNPGTRQLGYDVTLVPLVPLAGEARLPSASLDRIGGVYLHRRAARPNGGVAFILAKSPSPRVQGRVTLSEAEAADLRAGKFYLSVVSRTSPLASARADLVFA